MTGTKGILRSSSRLLSCGVAVCALATSTLFAAPTESVLYSFTGSFDGGRPNGNVILDGSGNIFGTTLYGGSFRQGNVYELIPNSNGYGEKVLYTFTGGADGGYPAAGLTIDSKGNLYGTAQMANSQFTGVVFKLSPPTASETTYTYSVLYSFSGGADGGFPNCSLLLTNTGALLGTTTKGGDFGNGTVFKLVPTGDGNVSETVIYSFTGGDDGALPFASVLQDGSGNLFGTAVVGGVYGKGTAWELVPNAANGSYTFNTLHAFTGGGDGGHPYSPLILPTPGTLYGTTFGGGANGYGTVYKLTAGVSGSFTANVVHAFTGDDGANEASGLVYQSSTNTFFGTTFSFASFGTVFSITPPATKGGAYTYTVIHRFAGAPTDGANPLASVSFDTSGNLYSTTYLGGTYNAGTVFEITNP